MATTAAYYVCCCYYSQMDSFLAAIITKSIKINGAMLLRALSAQGL